MLVDVTNRDAPVKRAAFDHDRLATALGAVTGGRYTAHNAAFQQLHVHEQRPGHHLRGGQRVVHLLDHRIHLRARGSGQPVRVAADAVAVVAVRRPTTPDIGLASPDGKRIAYINNYNVFIRDAGQSTDQGIALSRDGSEGNPYMRQSLTWAPNSRYLAAWRVRPGYQRMVRYVVSSPPDQVQPKYFERFYAKPGDVLDLQQPTLFDVESRKQTNVDNTLFPDPFNLSAAPVAA